MICGLVDVEFMKLVLGLHNGEGPLDKFFNANINLATGLQAMNVFRPEPAIMRKTMLQPLKEFTSWDKVEIQGEISLQALIAKLKSEYGADVQRLFPAGDDKASIFDKIDLEKLNWKIELSAGKVDIQPEAVYSAWPQLRTASQMLGRLPDGAAKKNFEAQITAAANSLQRVKDTFKGRFEGPASQAFIAAVRPSDEQKEKQAYFDRVQLKRKYVALQAHVNNRSGEEAELPLIRYSFKQYFFLLARHLSRTVRCEQQDQEKKKE